MQFAGVRNDMAAAYRAADVVLLPRWWRACRLYSSRRARRAGRGGHDRRGIGEIVDDGVTGLLCPSGTTPAVARQLLSLAGEPRLREEMCAAVADRIRAEDSAEAGVGRLLAVHRSARGVAA
ncbi:hypothetical protein NGF75_08350 [Dietzia kunjamensis]|uniref:hypothetical protein n=1 Tax=Dietzia kunjamensis TaxID=322509 RepID=UPI002DBFF12F|nr:hypothetical protein [Dietzia kunjamensis]MEB8325997.1 hypothetical protein [Dietzia kunjamensis]